MNNPIKGILFDMDGVLIDAKEWHFESLNRALALFGFEISRYDHLVTYDGLPTRRKLEMLSLERGFPSGLHSLVNDLKQKYTMEIVESRCRPTFHHQYALGKLSHSHFRLAVCSNSIRQTVDQMLSRAGILKYFEITLSNQDVSRVKPDPEIYVTAMEKLQLSPRDCLIIEDNPNGIKAAIASGAHVLEVENPSDVTYNNISNKIKDIASRNA